MIWLLFLFFVSSRAASNMEDWLAHKVNDPETNIDILTGHGDKELEYQKEVTNMEIIREEPKSLDIKFGRLVSTHHYNSFEYPTRQTFDVAVEISETCQTLKLGFPIRHKEKTDIYYFGPTSATNHKIYKKTVKENELWCSVPDVGSVIEGDCEKWTCQSGLRIPFQIKQTTENAFDFFGRTIQRLEISFDHVFNYSEITTGSHTATNFMGGTMFGSGGETVAETMTVKKLIERGDPQSLCTMWDAVAQGGIRYGAFGGETEPTPSSCAEIGWEEPTYADCMVGDYLNDGMYSYDGGINQYTSDMMRWWYYHETQPVNYVCGHGFHSKNRIHQNNWQALDEHPDHFTHTSEDKPARLCKMDVRDKADKLSLLEKNKYLFHLDEIFRAQNAFNYWADKMCYASMCMLGAHNIEKKDLGMAIPLFVVPVDVGYSYYDITKSGYTFTYSKATKNSYCYYIPYESATLGGAKVSASPLSFPSSKKFLTGTASKLWKGTKDSASKLRGRMRSCKLLGCKVFSKMGTGVVNAASYLKTATKYFGRRFANVRRVHEQARRQKARARLISRRLKRQANKARKAAAKSNKKNKKATDAIKKKTEEIESLTANIKKQEIVRRNALQKSFANERMLGYPDLTYLRKSTEALKEVEVMKRKLSKAQKKLKVLNLKDPIKVAKRQKRAKMALERQNKMRQKLDQQIAEVRRYKRYGTPGVGYPIKRKIDVALITRIREVLLNGGLKAKITKNFNKFMRMQKKVKKANAKALKKAKGKAKKQAEKVNTVPDPLEISYWHETGTCYNPPCSLNRKFTGLRTDSAYKHKTDGTQGTYEWGQVSVEASFFSTSAKATAFWATNLEWDRTILHAHAVLEMPNAIEAGFAAVAGIMGVAAEFMITFELGVGQGVLHLNPSTPYSQLVDSTMVLNPSMTSSNCIELECGKPTFTSDQIKLKSSAEPFMNIPLTRYRSLIIFSITGTLPTITGGNSITGTTTNAVISGGSGSGLVVDVKTLNATALESITMTNAGSGYEVGDVITFAAVGNGSTAGDYGSFNYTLVAADFISSDAQSAGTGPVSVIKEYTPYTPSHIPSALPGELFLLGLAQNNSNSKLLMKCVSGEECTINGTEVTFDKYSALQPGVSHFELDVDGFNPLGEQYIYSLEAEGIRDTPENHPYLTNSMIAIISDETCETFGLTPILNIDNNPDVKDEVENLFAENTVPNPDYKYEKAEEFYDKVYYSDSKNKNIWAKTEIVDTFERYDVIYDIDDLDEKVSPVSHIFAASKWSYIPAGLTIVPKDPYITDKDLYIVKKELSPLGFGTQNMYGNPPSHTPKCTNQFRCICFKGNEYKYVKESEITSNKDASFMYMKQPVHSLHECKTAASTSGWHTKVGHNVDPAPVLVEHDESDFGCVRRSNTYVFYDIPYTVSTTGHDSLLFDNLAMGTKYSQTSSSNSATIYKLIRGKKVSSAASTRRVLTRTEGARLHHKKNIIEPKSHIKQGGYSYFPISRNYTEIKYLKTDITYLHDNELNPYRLIQEGEDYVFNNNYIEIYSHNMERQEGEYGEKPDITLTMLNVTTLDISIPQIITDIPDHVYNTNWDGIEVDVDIFENGVLVGGAHTQLKHIACRPLVKLAGEQSYYRLLNGTWVYLDAYEDLDGNNDTRLCGHLPVTTVDNSFSCTLSHSFPNQCPKDYGLGVSKWNGTTYDHDTDTGDVPFVNGNYRQCSKCPEGTSSPNGHTRCLGHEHTITNDVGEFHTTIFDDPYHSYVHATHLQKYHFEEGNDYHPTYRTVDDIDYIDNEVYSDTRYLICKGGFVPKRQVIQPTWTSTCDLEWEHAEVNQIPESDCIGFTSQWNSNCTLQNGTTISNLTEAECHEKDYRNFRSFCTLPDDTIRFTYGVNCEPFNGKSWSSTCTLPNSEESDISHNECILSAYEGTCSGYKCERCPDQFIERQQMCMPCAPGYVAGWAYDSTPNECVQVNVPTGHFFDSQNSDGSTVGGNNYPYTTHCDHWLYHPLGGIGAYQNETNQLVCKTATRGSMATFDGRVIDRPSDPGQKINNNRTEILECRDEEVCDGEQIIGCKPGYIWYRQTDNREDKECALCNQGDIDHSEKDDYEYCDGTHRFQCADASYTNGTLQDGNYVGVRSTWTGSNLVKYESQEETSPAGGHQYNYKPDWNISQARVQDNLPWDGSNAVCKAVPDGYFALDGEWKLHDCGYARDKCIHRTFHRIYPFRHPTNLAAKYMFTEAVRETSYDEVFRMSSRQCDDGFLKDGCLKEYCSREGQTNCWCGEEEDFCKFACVDGMCLPSCGDQVCNPNYEICYGIGVDAECTRKCNGPMDNYCVTDHNGYARLCRHYNEDWNTTKFAYLEPSSPCFEEMPNIPETQCKSTTDRNCFCGREYHDDKHKACKERKIVSSCSVIQDDRTCTYMTLTNGECLCGDGMISGTCYQMNDKCGPYGSDIPDCDIHLEKITNTLTQRTTKCRPTGIETLINPAQCREGTITKKYTGTIDNIEEKFECDGVASDEPGCMDRHANNYNQYAVIPKKCEY